jgi:Tfp pilus assembly protein PilF
MSLAITIGFAFAPAAFANSSNATNATNTTNAFLGHTPNKGSEIQHLRLFDVSALPQRGERYLGSTRTATLYFKKGVKNFEKGDLEKASQHFRAALRADGSKGLDKATYHYLVNIAHKQGDQVKTQEYAQAYSLLN